MKKSKAANGNGKNLVIVESPAKAKTIQKYLGNSYRVISSMGHIRDLPDKSFGVDIEKGFKPVFTIIRGKKKLVDEIKKMAQGSRVLLASDLDREGEAIAWHLAQILHLNPDDNIRVIFNEITKDVIQKAVKTPRKIDLNKVNAQLARRILDRIVGYKISPLLWKILKSGLSAGRVQSVALRFICEREEEIKKFVPKEYWRIYGLKDENKIFLSKLEGKKFDPLKLGITREKSEEIIKELKERNFVISSINEEISKKTPPAPYITSTLQQEAANRLGFSVAKTMKIAQELYEGVETPEGNVAFITYMRTDSTRISEEAAKRAKEFIKNKFGDEYTSKGKSKTGTQKRSNVQDAHEAIRPTYVDKTPDEVKSILKADHWKLYKLIWERFVASQMAPSKYRIQTVEISSEDGKYSFIIENSERIFDGFEAIYKTSNGGNNFKFENLKEGNYFTFDDFGNEQKFTEPPTRYTEASLVKKLEREGIGRPSTYASIINTLFERKYVIRKNRFLVPTFIGFLVNEFLIKNFPKIVESKFTAIMEAELDEIENGKKVWKEVLDEFYREFEKDFSEISEKINSGEYDVEFPTDMKCEECEQNMKLKFGRFGSYLKCESCGKTVSTKNEENFYFEGEILHVKEAIESFKEEETGEKCPKCGSPLVVRKSRYGKFIGCSAYPSCDYTRPLIEYARGNCPKCGGKVLMKKSKKRKTYYICENNLEKKGCDFISWYEPSNYNCPDCSNRLFYRNKSGVEMLYCESCKKYFSEDNLK
jgi:DNA topoisomerase-1